MLRLMAFVATALLCTVSRGAEAAPKDPKRAPVVAVLPFKVLNKEENLNHYGEGASDTIINKIVNDKALKVVEESQLDKAVNALARNQTGLFEEDSALAIGQMVDARYIVIGSVQLVGDDKSGQIKVNARVLEVETRQLLVSESVFGPIAAAFQQYEEIGARLVTKMTNHLAQRTEGASADSVAVSQLIDDGKSFDPAFPPVAGVAKDLSKALTAYNKAVLRDPKSARAYLALGHGELRLAEDQQKLDPTRSRQTLVTSREHLKRSAELDGQNPFAWTQLGRAEGRLANHVAAGDAFQHALAIDSQFVAARFGLAVALLSTGDLEAAHEQATQARAQGEVRADALLKSIDQQLALKKEKPSAAAQK